MGQQISIEAAYEAYRDRAAEMFHENVLLKARVAELEGALSRMQGAAPQETPMPHPGMPGGLGAAPAEQAPDGDHADFDQQYHLER